jgi:hypothetical protein
MIHHVAGYVTCIERLLMALLHAFELEHIHVCVYTSTLTLYLAFINELKLKPPHDGQHLTSN